MDVTLAMAVTPAGAAIITAILVQAVKGEIADRWVPKLALCIGVLVTVAASWALGVVDRAGLGQAVLSGIVAGAASVGIYENVKRQ